MDQGLIVQLLLLYQQRQNFISFDMLLTLDFSNLCANLVHLKFVISSIFKLR